MKVLIIHPQPLFILGLQRALSCMGSSWSVKSIRALGEDEDVWRSFRVDLVMVDHAAGCGTKQLRNLRRSSPCKVICFSPTGICRLRRGGADASVRPTAEIDAVIEVVRRLCRRDESPRRSTGLTARELEIIRLIAHGERSPQIARTLYISQNTVKTHLRNICEKLKVKGQVAIARWWHRSVD